MSRLHPPFPRLLLAALVASLIALAALGALRQGATAAAPTPADQTTLDTNRARWDALEIRDYRLITRQSCFCPFQDAVRVTVQDGLVTHVGDPFGFGEPPPDGAGLTVRDLFDRVQQMLDLPADDLTVEYDPDNGIPLSISADPIALAIDDEFSITVERFNPIPGAAERAELDANRARWAATGIRDYRLTTFLGCFCIDIAPVTVTVRDGVISTIDPPDAPAFQVFTVDKLFDEIDRAIAQPVDSLRVRYDPANGVPLNLDIDEDFGIADEERFIEVRSFTALTVPADALTMPAGWNLVGWRGATPVATATESIAGAFDAIFGWSPDQRRFDAFFPGAPPAANSLAELERGQGYWVRITDPNGAVWQQPPLTEPLVVDLVAGLNLVMWGGPSGVAIEDAIGDLGRALRLVSLWDAPAQAFRSFAPDRPPFLNTATTLLHGQGLWLDVNRDLTWRQPFPISGTTVEVGEGEPVTLAPGDLAVLAGSPLQVRFDRVSFDNRCPSDVTCITGGEVRAEITTIIDGLAQARTLVVPNDGQPIDLGNFFLDAVSVGPTPLSTVLITPDAYRLSFQLRRDPFQAGLVRAPIRAVEIAVAESFPVQIFVAITSLAPSSCETFDHVTTTRQGTTITINVWNRGQPPAVLAPCLAVETESQHNLALGSDFVPGVEYRVLVGDEQRRFTTP